MRGIISQLLLYPRLFFNTTVIKYEKEWSIHFAHKFVRPNPVHSHWKLVHPDCKCCGQCIKEWETGMFVCFSFIIPMTLSFSLIWFKERWLSCHILIWTFSSEKGNFSLHELTWGQLPRERCSIAVYYYIMSNYHLWYIKKYLLCLF